MVMSKIPFFVPAILINGRHCWRRQQDGHERHDFISVLKIYIDQIVDLEQIDELCTVHKTVDIKYVNEC
jgi:hypothetical protein